MGQNSEIAPRLFTKFTTTFDVGTGLGLYLFKSIVEAHGGIMWAANNPDGKVLHLVLPCHGFQMTRTKVTKITKAMGVIHSFPIAYRPKWRIYIDRWESIPIIQRLK
jgi:hypothetical protein